MNILTNKITCIGIEFHLFVAVFLQLPTWFENRNYVSREDGLYRFKHTNMHVLNVTECYEKKKSRHVLKLTDWSNTCLLVIQRARASEFSIY